MDAVLRFGLPEGICLNVNIPNTGSEPEKLQVAVPCRGHWNDEYKEYRDPSGRKFYLLCGEFINDEPDNELTDEWCLSHGIVSVVPTSVNRTTPIPASLAWISNLPELYTK